MFKVSVAIFSVTLPDRAQVFVKKVTIYENDNSVCFHFFYKDKMGRAKRIWHEKNICCFALRLLQCNFKKVKIKQLEE